jgi:hypothetical protein
MCKVDLCDTRMSMGVHVYKRTWGGILQRCILVRINLLYKTNVRKIDDLSHNTEKNVRSCGLGTKVVLMSVGIGHYLQTFQKEAGSEIEQCHAQLRHFPPNPNTSVRTLKQQWLVHVCGLSPRQW